MTDETREIVKEVALAATPEEVWEAVATGPGITCWFVPSEVEPRVGGTITQDFGMPGKVEGVVTAWEPGRRFAFGAAGQPGPLGRHPGFRVPDLGRRGRHHDPAADPQRVLHRRRLGRRVRRA